MPHRNLPADPSCVHPSSASRPPVTRLSVQLALIIALALSAGCDSASSGSSGYSTSGVPSRYADGAHQESDEADEADDRADELRQAKEDFETNASELRDAVSALSHTTWSDQMHTIQSQLDEAEESLERLEAVGSSDPAVRSARDELDTMRSHMTRLQHENWRTVRPDLETASEAIEDESTSVSDTPDDE